MASRLSLSCQQKNHQNDKSDRRKQNAKPNSDAHQKKRDNSNQDNNTAEAHRAGAVFFLRVCILALLGVTLSV